jgi:hypothetical protein
MVQPRPDAKTDATASRREIGAQYSGPVRRKQGFHSCSFYLAPPLQRPLVKELPAAKRSGAFIDVCSSSRACGRADPIPGAVHSPAAFGPSLSRLELNRLAGNSDPRQYSARVGPVLQAAARTERSAHAFSM